MTAYEMRINDGWSDVCAADLYGVRDHWLGSGAADERPKLVDSLRMVRKPGFDGLFRRARLPGDAAKQIWPELLETAHQSCQQKPVPAVRRIERQRRALRPVDAQRLADDGVGLCQRHFAALAPHSGGKVGDSNGAVKAVKLDDPVDQRSRSGCAKQFVAQGPEVVAGIGAKQRAEVLTHPIDARTAFRATHTRVFSG